MADGSDALRELIDKSAITEVLTRYMRGIDRGDLAAVRACYAPDATEEHGGLYSGSAQGYIDSIGAALTNPRLVATHTISNLLIDLDGDDALAEHYVLAMTRLRAGGAGGVVSDAFIASRIVDNLVRIDGEWKIARRRLRFDWAHELGPRPDTWAYGTLDPAALLHGAKYPDDIVYEGVARLSGAAT
jgi:ketosteroid isomerase-like protein